MATLPPIKVIYDHKDNLMALASAALEELAKQRKHHTERQSELTEAFGWFLNVVKKANAAHDDQCERLHQTISDAVVSANMLEGQQRIEALCKENAKAEQHRWHDARDTKPFGGRWVIVKTWGGYAIAKYGMYALGNLGWILPNGKVIYSVESWANIPPAD